MSEPSQHSQEVLERLLKAHEAYFDVERDHEYAGRTFPGYAELHSNASQYVLVKRAKLWETSSHEYLFFALAGHLDAETFDDLVTFMKTEALGKVTLDPDHMNSFLSLVIIADTVDVDVARRVRTTRFRKNYFFGLKGWSDLRLCVVSLADEAIYANGMGKTMTETLRANAFC